MESVSPDSQREIYTRLIRAHLSAKGGLFEQADRLFSTLAHDPQSPMSVRWEAQAGRAQIHAAEGKHAIAEREFRESTDTISKARGALQHEDFRLSFLSSAIRFYDAYVNFLIDRHRPLEALRIADLSRAQTLEAGLSPSSHKQEWPAVAFNPQAVARRLNVTLLFYWLADQRSYLWAITPAKTTLITLPASAEIDAAVKSYRQAFLDPRDPIDAGNADGKKLYSVLIEPAEKLIPRNSRVVVLPDGSLNSLNFETLIVPGSNRKISRTTGLKTLRSPLQTH
jgi:hypothetical protein